MVKKLDLSRDKENEEKARRCSRCATSRTFSEIRRSHRPKMIFAAEMTFSEGPIEEVGA